MLDQDNLCPNLIFTAKNIIKLIITLNRDGDLPLPCSGKGTRGGKREEGAGRKKGGPAMNGKRLAERRLSSVCLAPDENEVTRQSAANGFNISILRRSVGRLQSRQNYLFR